jgi:hypothetical protein
MEKFRVVASISGGNIDPNNKDDDVHSIGVTTFLVLAYLYSLICTDARWGVTVLEVVATVLDIGDRRRFFD